VTRTGKKEFLPVSPTWRQKFPADPQNIFVLNLHVHKHMVFWLTMVLNWVVPEKLHTLPTEEISAVRRGRGDNIVSDNSKCIRTSEGGRGVNFQFLPWRWYGCFLE
jgi:hypothetical protein